MGRHFPKILQLNKKYLAYLYAFTVRATNKPIVIRLWTLFPPKKSGEFKSKLNFGIIKIFYV